MKGKSASSQSLLASLNAKNTYDMLASQNASPHRQALTHKIVSQKQKEQIMRLSQPKLRVSIQSAPQSDLELKTQQLIKSSTIADLQRVDFNNLGNQVNIKQIDTASQKIALAQNMNIPIKDGQAHLELKRNILINRMGLRPLKN